MKHSRILMAVLAIMAATLACTMNVGGPKSPERTIPVSTEAVGSLEAQIQQAMQSAQNGQVTFFITEEQLTSLLATKLQSNPDSIITDPQVFLNDGTIQIFGKAKQGFFEATIGVVLTVGVDANGQPVIDITSADFGPIPVPDGLKESITALVQEAYTGSLGPAASGFRLEAVLISNGTMALTGKLK
jgi:hypothetical protein